MPISHDNLTLATQAQNYESCKASHVPGAEEGSTISNGVSILTHATPHHMVSSFCRAVLSRILPGRFWGVGDDGVANKNNIMAKIGKFISLRRFETLSLHEISQGLKVCISECCEGVPADSKQFKAMHWLNSTMSNDVHCAVSEFQKRREILLEFLYYIFDSLLIPLIRNNFHVADSNTHRYRLFYFRHDTWRTLTEPALQDIKLRMFEEVDSRVACSRQLGYSQLRLLPKEHGLRPIMNLRCRRLENNSKTLGRSINTILAPVHNMFTWEMVSPKKTRCIVAELISLVCQTSTPWFLHVFCRRSPS